MSGHTKGPWRVDARDSFHNADTIRTEDGRLVALTRTYTVFDGQPNDDQNPYDALLIAVAPEFASVCQTVLALDAETDMLTGNEHVRDALRGVLTKAGVPYEVRR